MRALLFPAAWFGLTYLCANGQTRNEPSVEVASVKLASPHSTRIGCAGGPGTPDPGLWTCTNVSVSFLIWKAFGYDPYQFNPGDSCCQTRVDLTAKVPPDTTRAQFRRMQQNLLIERFKLRVHLQRKEMPIYELTVDNKGSKMKNSPPNAVSSEQDPWDPPKSHPGKDGYAEFLPGQEGVVNLFGNYRWIGVNLSMRDIANTLSAYAGRLVVDSTGLAGKYDIDLKWTVDVAAVLAEIRRQAAGAASGQETPAHDETSGPTLMRAVRDQLGLKLNAKRGEGDVVVVDHIEKLPLPN